MLGVDEHCGGGRETGGEGVMEPPLADDGEMDVLPL
jgi:hypothetical protein